MATLHQASPPGSIHQHHRAPPAHLQPNGHNQLPPNQAAPPPPPPQRPQPQNSLEAMTIINELMWIQLGRCQEVMDNNEEAVKSYQRALDFNRSSLEALNSIASVLRSDDKYEQAAEYINTILQLQPSDGDSWSSLGHCYLMMDELQKAYAAYQSALYNLRDPKEPKLWYGIGILYDRYGSLEHAEEAFSQVMRMAPNFDKANEIYFRLGIIYKQQGKFGESLECFRYIVGNPPRPLNETDIWFQIGHVYEQQKDYESAKEAYRRVLERDPNHAKVLQQLGWLHHQQSPDYNSQEQAIDYLEKSVNSDQSDPQSWYLLGRCYMSQHKFPKAYEAYQQAVYRDGRNPTFWCSIGVLYYQINQYRDALDAYSRAIRLNPNISEVWYDLGTLYESCNNQTSDALDAYQRAAELDPNNQHIKARLQLLRNGQPTGMANQNGVPLPQDIHPQAYQAAGVSGPPQPQWASQAQGPAPQPPLTASREWNHRGPEFERDARGYQAPRPGSPREQARHQETPRHGAIPQPRPMSPSPRTRNTYRGQPSQTAPHHPQQQQPQQQPQPQQQQPPPPPPPNRISNPNFNAQTLPPAPVSGPPQQGQPPTYSRNSPPPQVRPIVEGRAPSPSSSGYPSHAQYQHHADPNGPSNIASGAPAPSSALAAAEAAARERDERPPSVIKRQREWEDREESGAHKKNANEESRARLDDPYLVRRSPGPQTLPSISHERSDSRVPIGGPITPQTHGVSQEEIRRADQAYRPSEAAHHPQPIGTVLQHEAPKAASTPAPSQAPAHLPPMQPAPTPASPAAAAVPASAHMSKREDTPPNTEERKRKEELERREREQRDRDAQMRVDEPAARKMDLDEDYDDEEEPAKDKGAKEAGPDKASPKNAGFAAGGASVHGVTNGASAAAQTEDQRPKVEASA